MSLNNCSVAAVGTSRCGLESSFKPSVSWTAKVVFSVRNRALIARRTAAVISVLSTSSWRSWARSSSRSRSEMPSVSRS